MLEAQASTDADVRDFQTELRACTEGALTGSDDAQYSEAKFLQVKAHHRALPRPRGLGRARPALDRQGHRRAQLVRVRRQRALARGRHASTSTTPTRAASPAGRRRSSPTPSSPPAWPTSSAWSGARCARARSASWSSTRPSAAARTNRREYGLRLFTQLNLQLLIVTPLQKIHIIEPFVASVGFVHNEDGSASMLRNLTIEEYRARKRDAST